MKKMLSEVATWNHFREVYLIVSLISGAIMFQTSLLIGLYNMLQGVLVFVFPIENCFSPKIGKRILIGVCMFHFAIMVADGFLGLQHLIRGVVTLFYGLY